MINIVVLGIDIFLQITQIKYYLTFTRQHKKIGQFLLLKYGKHVL